MTRFIATFLLLICASAAYAGTTIDPSRTTYLGRTLGMGGAQVAVANDGEGVFANPAGLAFIKYPQITGLSRKILLDETAYSVCSFVVPTRFGNIGFGYTGASVGGSYATYRDSNNRIAINPSLEAMSYDSNVMLLTYAKPIVVRNVPLSFGGNLKMFNQSISGGNVGSRGTAFNLDLGATYRPQSFLTVGATLQNLLGGSIKWNNSEDKLGGFYKLGVGVGILGASQEALLKNDQKLIGAFDIDLPHDVLGSATLMHAGLEWTPLKFLMLRAGLNQEIGGTGMTFGLGLKQDGFRFDYAYAARPGVISDNPHYFSLSYVGDLVTTQVKKVHVKDSKDKKDTVGNKENAIKILSPKNRYITSAEAVHITAEAKFANLYDLVTNWTVPVITSTSETQVVREYKNLVNVYIDYQKTDKAGTVEGVSRPLPYGRQVLSVVGYTTPEVHLMSAEVIVLRFDPFRDTPMTYWAIEPIALNVELGLITGYPDKTFKPEKGISRAELTALLVRTMDISPEALKAAAKANKFADITETHWAATYINIASEMGLVKGYPDNTFRPKNVLNRAEGIAILARYAKLPEKDFVSFPDLSDGFWANKHITAAKEVGMLKFLEGKAFEHRKSFSRAEAAEVLYQSKPIQKRVNDFWEHGVTRQTGKVPDWMQPMAPVTPEATHIASIETKSVSVEVKSASAEVKTLSTKEAEKK